jgi:hypothetical protein
MRYHPISKGDLISDFLTMVPLPTRERCQITPMSIEFEFATLFDKQVMYLFKFSAQGCDLAPFVGNAMGLKSKYPLRLSHHCTLSIRSTTQISTYLDMHDYDYLLVIAIASRE